MSFLHSWQQQQHQKITLLSSNVKHKHYLNQECLIGCKFTEIWKWTTLEVQSSSQSLSSKFDFISENNLNLLNLSLFLQNNFIFKVERTFF